MNKNAQKIIYRGVRRLILGIHKRIMTRFNSYIDEQAHKELQELDLFYLKSNSTLYKSLIMELNFS